MNLIKADTLNKIRPDMVKPTVVLSYSDGLFVLYSL